MKHCTYPRNLIVAIVASAILIGGCSSNPYVRSPELVTSLPAASAANTSQFAGDLEPAI